MHPLADRVLDLACAIQQIPAPTFAEAARAQFVRSQLVAAGLADVTQDVDGNVYARRPGAAGPSRPILVTAHTDTVFPAGTPLTLTRGGGRLHGPGIGDNSLGVAGLLGLVWALEGEVLPADVWLAANVCEEGLGDLRGMRQVMAQLGGRVKATLVLEGMALGQIYHAGIGVRRLRFTAHAEGGHSWLNFGRPSAIHALVRFGAQLTELPAPVSPKTTFNIGTLAGGTSINTIAREASLDLDLRSEERGALESILARVEALVAQHNRQGAQIEMTVIGDRPSGRLAPDHPLVRLAAQALTEVGYTPKLDHGSTDANIPLSQGRPCVCIGLTHGGNAHRPDEYIETGPLAKGLQALVSTVRQTLAWSG
jgi:acetylornithine deacetylase/succinyl-diaminopimelate desuccinylase-like protein